MKKTLAVLALAALCLGLLGGCAVQAPEIAGPPASSETSVSGQPPAFGERPADSQPPVSGGPEPDEHTPEEPPVSSLPPSDSQSPASSDPPPAADPALESLAALRQLAADQGALCAGAYLGYAWDGVSIADFLAGDDAAIWLQRQPFLAAIPQDAHVRQPGGEIYCIVPPTGGTVSVHINMVEGFTPPLDKGQTSLLYAGGDSPILLMGNESDIVSNLQVTVTAADGTTAVFNPTVSLKDGSFYPMGADGAVYDFTLAPTEF